MRPVNPIKRSVSDSNIILHGGRQPPTDLLLDKTETEQPIVEFSSIKQIQNDIESRIRANTPKEGMRTVIGIAGGSGSGKTTLARMLKEDLGDEAVLLSLDNYMTPPPLMTESEKNQFNYDAPDRIDDNMLIAHINALKSGRAIPKQTYSFKNSALSNLKSQLIPAPKKFIILEGLQVLYFKKIKALLDLKLFVDVSSSTRFIRNLIRNRRERGKDFEFTFNRWFKSVEPTYKNSYFPTRFDSDVIYRRSITPASQTSRNATR